MAAAGFRAAILALLCAACTSVLATERTFDGTRWHVTAIDGRATPPADDYHVEFHGRSIGGRFGCNGFGGDYAITGDLMSAGNIRSTMMACSELTASFEARGFAVLRLPMSIRWTSERALSLSNSAGSIALERMP